LVRQAKNAGEFIGFLTNFEDATDKLEASNMPTPHLMILRKLNLLSLVEIKPDYADLVRKLRERQNHFLWTCGQSSHITHKLAIFLLPKYNGLTFLNYAEKEVKAEARMFMSVRSPHQDKEDEYSAETPTKK
jgi:hypothetical protein